MPAILKATKDGFMRDSKPHLIISGAFHYFRAHPEQWEDRLKRLAAMGLNTVETYVAWNLHEPRPGEYNFSGIADLERFLNLAKAQGLDAIVRPGPYICAEWENGGFPGWLLKDRNIKLRTMHEGYLAQVDKWFDVLVPIIARHQAANGGNVIMVQVENEYGSYRDDKTYLEYLRDGLIRRGIEELLVTSDGAGPEWLSGGSIDGALATLNFGSRTERVLQMASKELPDQPQMCMEYWNGWFDHWGEDHHRRDASSVAAELEVMLKNNMSVNFYMAYGGTNFGLSAGSNFTNIIQPTTTSYDYHAPIAENGELTEKFFKCREVIAKYVRLPELSTHLKQLGIEASPRRLPAQQLPLKSLVKLRETELFNRFSSKEVYIPSFEDAALERGMMHLSREIEIKKSLWSSEDFDEIEPLRIYNLHDRAWVYVDGIFAGAVGYGAVESDIARLSEITEITTNPAASHQDPAIVDLTALIDELLPDREEIRNVRLDILVEGFGRVNFGPRLGENKGVLGGVWHTVRYLSDWQVDTWPLEEMGATFSELSSFEQVDYAEGRGQGSKVLPALIKTSFRAEEANDTFISLADAGQGFLYVNGFCVGRYWNRGPQQSLYIPAPLVKAGENEVLLIEFERLPTEISLVEEHIFSS